MRRDNFGDVDIDGKIILNSVLKDYVKRICLTKERGLETTTLVMNLQFP
jgi:hypothetical protein